MKIYTDDFRRDAVKYADDHPTVPIRDVAKYLDIPKETLYGWTRTAYSNKLFGKNNPVPGPKTEIEKENNRLRRELRDTQDALEILKKPSAF